MAKKEGGKDFGPVGGKDGAPTSQPTNGGRPQTGFGNPPNQDASATTGEKPGGYGQNPRRPH